MHMHAGVVCGLEGQGQVVGACIHPALVYSITALGPGGGSMHMHAGVVGGIRGPGLRRATRPGRAQQAKRGLVASASSSSS